MNLYIINSTKHRHKFLLRLDKGQLSPLNIPAGGQEVLGDEYEEVTKFQAIQHIERYGGMEISGPKNTTPPNFYGLAYRWDRPANPDTIEAAFETDMVRRRKVSARERINAAKGMDGMTRAGKMIAHPGDVVTISEIQEIAPLGETLPSGGLSSTIISAMDGGKLEIK